MRACVLLAFVAAAACGGGGGSNGGPTAPTTPTPPTTPGNPVATTSVSLQSSTFEPPHIVVAPSAVVTFTNNDNLSHNVSFAEQSIARSGNWTTGARTITMPAAAGTYPYTCTLHAGMNGSVKVE